MAKNKPFRNNPIPTIPTTPRRALSGNPQGTQWHFYEGNPQNMRVWTSRYGNQEAIIESNAVPVCITVGKPKLRLRYELVEEIPPFKPAGSLFRINDKEELRTALYAKLDQVGSGEVRRILNDISRRHGYRDIVLLCFEDVKKPGEWCHRQLIADWLNKHGFDVQELEAPVLGYDYVGV